MTQDFREVPSMDKKCPPLEIKILIEASPLKSRILVWILASAITHRDNVQYRLRQCWLKKAWLCLRYLKKFEKARYSMTWVMIHIRTSAREAKSLTGLNAYLASEIRRPTAPNMLLPGHFDGTKSVFLNFPDAGISPDDNKIKQWR